MADWLVRIGDTDYPARSIDEIRQWRAEGRVTDSTYIYHPVLQRWMYPREIEELRDVAGGAAYAAPAAAPPKKGFFARPMACLAGCGAAAILFVGLAFVTGATKSCSNTKQQEQVAQTVASAKEKSVAALSGGKEMPAAAVLRNCDGIADFAGVADDVKTRCAKAYADAANEAAKAEDMTTAQKHVQRARAAGGGEDLVKPAETAIARAETAARERKKTAVAAMRKDEDKLENTTWYADKSSPKFNNVDAFYIYFGEKEGNRWLRLRAQYHDDRWLFAHSFTVYADGKPFEYNGVKFERDHRADIWEWYDDGVDARDLEMIRAVIKSKEATIRYNGRQYRDDRTISTAQKRALQRVLDAYEARGGTV